jgi:uncharacterized protein (DUF58 family)
MGQRLLFRVKSTLFIHARRRARTVLEGEYESVFHGRSLDYDDLRDYLPGDEVRDIDWKATARMSAPMVRRYVAPRKLHVLIVADTGRGMAAVTDSGEAKKDVAIMAAGLIGYLADRHGDLVGLVHGSRSRTCAHEPRGSEEHLERLLHAMDTSTDLAADHSDLASQLRWVVRHVKHRTVLLVLADDRELAPGLDQVLRRLQAQHEVLWITTADADPTTLAGDRSAYDVADGYLLPAEVRLQPEVRQAYAVAVAERVRSTARALDRLGINHVRVGSSDAVVVGVLRLLERQRRAR